MWCGIAKSNAGPGKKLKLDYPSSWPHISSVAPHFLHVCVCLWAIPFGMSTYLHSCTAIVAACVWIVFLCARIHIERFSVGILRCRRCTQQSNGEQKSFGINIIIWISCISFASDRMPIAKHEPNSLRRPLTRHSRCKSETRMHEIGQWMPNSIHKHSVMTVIWYSVGSARRHCCFWYYVCFRYLLFFLRPFNRISLKRIYTLTEILKYRA